MSKNKSLLTHFLPPREELKGQFCFLSGFSASTDFLDKALENFTTYNSLQRANRHVLNMTLFLDKRKSQINGVSGLYHSMLEPAHNNKFSLMHAKVGVMTFARDEFSPVEVFRLLVCTGNWTRMGMKENMDLIWTSDYELNGENEEPELQLADLTKGIQFFQNLMEWYQVPQKVRGELSKISGLLPKATEEDLSESRFFSTFDRVAGKRISMYDGIKSRFIQHNSTKPYNKIYCGSGFYESSEGEEALEVFHKLETDFCAGKPFARNVAGEVVANQKDLWKFKDLQKPKSRINWSVCEPLDHFAKKGPRPRQMLHAKFIFAGYQHQDNFTQLSLYLGSGNLSKKGLLTTLDNPQGNVEAGVVLRHLDFNPNYTVANLLCMGKIVSPESLKEATGTDDYEELEGDPIFASPIKAIFNFHVETRQGEIEWGENPRECFYMLDAQTKVHIAKDQTKFELPPECELRGHLMVICEGENHPHFVPIISADGEYCVTPPIKLDAGSAFDALMMFPEMPVDDEDSDDEEIGDSFERASKVRTPQLGKGSARTLSQAMEMVEGIARKNQATSRELLPSWINRLEYTLTKCLMDQEIEAFSSLKINFLDTLKQEHFSPPWNLISDSSELKVSYEAAIDKIAEAWQMKGYPTFEEKV